MKPKIKTAIKKIIQILEIIYIPLFVISALMMWLYRRTGSNNLKLSTRILKRIGIFPIRDHYYEPMFNDKNLVKKT